MAMTLEFTPGARALDGAAAAIFTAAVAYSTTAVGSVALAALLTPLAFAATYALLGKIADEPVHRLAGFEFQAVDRPQPSPVAGVDDAKVVHMFGPDRPASAPSASSRDGGDAGAGDAARALSEALAALRRSLR